MNEKEKKQKTPAGLIPAGVSAFIWGGVPEHLRQSGGTVGKKVANARKKRAALLKSNAALEFTNSKFINCNLCLLQGVPGDLQAGIKISVAHLFYMRVNLDWQVVYFGINREGESGRSALAVFLGNLGLYPAAFAVGDLHLMKISGLFAIGHWYGINCHSHFAVADTKTGGLLERRVRHGSLVLVRVPEVNGYIVSAVGNFFAALGGSGDGSNHNHGCECHNDGDDFSENALFQVNSSFLKNAVTRAFRAF